MNSKFSLITSGNNAHMSMSIVKKDEPERVMFTEYAGEYTVVPSVANQALPSKNTRVRENIVVNGVPTYEVSNGTGGTTFVIGG